MTWPSPSLTVRVQDIRLMRECPASCRLSRDVEATACLVTLSQKISPKNKIDKLNRTSALQAWTTYVPESGEEDRLEER